MSRVREKSNKVVSTIICSHSSSSYKRTLHAAALGTKLWRKPWTQCSSVSFSTQKKVSTEKELLVFYWKSWTHRAHFLVLSLDASTTVTFQPSAHCEEEMRIERAKVGSHKRGHPFASVWFVCVMSKFSYCLHCTGVEDFWLRWRRWNVTPMNASFCQV